MKTYLITYETFNLGLENSFIEEIKKFEYWARPTNFVWLVKTDLNRNQIFNKIRPFLGISDKLLVIEVTQDWISDNLTNDVVNWMRY